jgi:hypothetical protein
MPSHGTFSIGTAAAIVLGGIAAAALVAAIVFGGGSRATGNAASFDPLDSSSSSQPAGDESHRPSSADSERVPTEAEIEYLLDTSETPAPSRSGEAARAPGAQQVP